jgi:hypothetical protein
MRRALLHLLIEEMGSSFSRSKERVRSQRGDLTSSQEELEAMVGDAVRKARRRSGKSHRRASLR